MVAKLNFRVVERRYRRIPVERGTWAAEDVDRLADCIDASDTVDSGSDGHTQ